MQHLAAAAALSSVILQCVFLAFAHTLYALVSWIFSACCLWFLAIIHPVIAIARRRQAAYGNHRQITAQQMLEDPVVQSALMQPAPPAPWKHTCIALGLFIIADLCDGLRVSGLDGPTHDNLWEAAHEFYTAIAVALLFWTTRGLGATPSSTLYGACYTAGVLAALQLLSLMPPLGAAAVAGADAPADESWRTAAGVGCLACRTIASSALTAQALSAVCGALFPAHGDVYQLSTSQADVLRWAVQALGGLLLLAPPAMRALLKAPHAGGALALGASRLAVACLTLSAWFALYPAEHRDDEDLDVSASGAGGAGGGGGYQSASEMKAARKAARERRTAEPAPPPLMLESLHRRGGVQGLDWHDASLYRDKDGDEAHAFFEEVSGGGLRPVLAEGRARRK